MNRNTMSLDHAALRGKLAANATALAAGIPHPVAIYERRNAPDLAETIGRIAEGFDLHKEAVNDLRARLDRAETKLARPGAMTGGSLLPIEVRTLTTQDGRKLPFLRHDQKLSDVQPDSKGDVFDLGEFCRATMIGSKEGKSSSGPALVPTGLSGTVIDRVRAKTVVVAAGSGTIIIDGPTTLARLTSDPTVYQHTEGAPDINESDITATPVVLNPKTLVVLVPLTMELVSDSPNLDAVLQTALANAFAGKLDALCLAALLADTSIPKSSVTQDPAIWAKTLEAVGAALAANQEVPFAHIGAPADFIARASQLASTAGSWLGKPPALASMRELFSTGVTAGTALFGDFAAGFAIAMRQELRVEVVRHAKPASGSHLLIAHMRADGVVLQANRLFKQLKTA